MTSDPSEGVREHRWRRAATRPGVLVAATLVVLVVGIVGVRVGGREESSTASTGTTTPNRGTTRGASGGTSAGTEMSDVTTGSAPASASASASASTTTVAGAPEPTTAPSIGIAATTTSATSPSPAPTAPVAPGVIHGHYCDRNPSVEPDAALCLPHATSDTVNTWEDSTTDFPSTPAPDAPTYQAPVAADRSFTLTVPPGRYHQDFHTNCCGCVWSTWNVFMEGVPPDSTSSTEPPSSTTTSTSSPTDWAVITNRTIDVTPGADVHVNVVCFQFHMVPPN